MENMGNVLKCTYDFTAEYRVVQYACFYIMNHYHFFNKLHFFIKNTRWAMGIPTGSSHQVNKNTIYT